MENKQQVKTKKDDPFFSIKYIAYCRSQLPPGNDTTMRDFVNFAKFFLCRETKTLWKDEIWNSYTEEEILVEYYSYLYDMDDGAKQSFEVLMDAGSDIYGEDIYEWLERKVEENQKEFEQMKESMPEKISFSPDNGEDVEE